MRACLRYASHTKPTVITQILRLFIRRKCSSQTMNSVTKHTVFLNTKFTSCRRCPSLRSLSLKVSRTVSWSSFGAVQQPELLRPEPPVTLEVEGRPSPSSAKSIMLKPLLRWFFPLHISLAGANAKLTRKQCTTCFQAFTNLFGMSDPSEEPSSKASTFAITSTLAGKPSLLSTAVSSWSLSRILTSHFSSLSLSLALRLFFFCLVWKRNQVYDEKDNTRARGIKLTKTKVGNQPCWNCKTSGVTHIF